MSGGASHFYRKGESLDLGEYSSTTAGITLPKVNDSDSLTARTITGKSGIITVTGLTTGGGVTESAMTVTNTECLATSLVQLFVQEYGGAGQPVVWADNVAAGSFDVLIGNAADLGANLNANLGIGYIIN